MNRGLVALAVIVLSGLACASGGSGGTRATRCAPQPADSIYRAGAPVFRDCAVDRAARLLNPNVQVPWRPAGGIPSPGSRCYEALVEFVVDTTGKPESGTARVIRQNEPGFAKAVMSVLPDWRYQPARIGDQPVRQIVRERRTLATVVTTVVVPAGTSPEMVRVPAAPRC
jgi:hypothetical protein